MDDHFTVQIETQKLYGVAFAIKSICQNIEDRYGEDLDLLQKIEGLSSLGSIIQETVGQIEAELNI